jgi:serine/threonine-protein kinase
MVEGAARRLAIAAGVVGGIAALYVALYRWVWPDQETAGGRVAGVGIVLVSLIVAAALPRRGRAGWVVVGAGLIYEVLVCFSIATMEYWKLPAYQGAVPTISWNCVGIVFFPLLLPASPRQILLGSLLAAAMSPLAFGLWVVARGQPLPAPDVTLSLLLPPFVAAAAAWVPARILARLHKDVTRARQLGSYELVERLGSGGMGEVWRAHHRMLARPAAIKLIKPEILAAHRLAARQLVARFEREAQAIASLESPHTIELYDFGVADDGTFYYVMELLRGLDLERMVTRFGPLPPERAVHLLLQICDSLAEAHERGIVHRDVKPANLFACRRGRAVDFAKVLDFGLAKWNAAPTPDTQLDDRSWGPVRCSPGPGSAPPMPPDPARRPVHARPTLDHGLQGTPAYVAPEAVTGEVELDGRADLYSVGCVAYWMITSRYVFEEATAMKTALAHVTRAPEPPSRRTSRPIPPSLEQVIMACLEKDRDRRPASAVELARMLAACDAGAAWTADGARDWWAENLPDSVVIPGDDADTDRGAPPTPRAAIRTLVAADRAAFDDTVMERRRKPRG